MKTLWEQALDYLYRDLKRTRISIAHAERREGVRQEELEDLTSKAEVIEWLTALVLSKGVEDTKKSRKAKDCKFYTVNIFGEAGCLGTLEIDPCEGYGCERWQAKEESE